MLLKDIKTWVTVPPSGIGGAFWVIVKVTTDNGIEGIGECYGIPVSGDIACAMVEDTFERYIAGEDPHHIETMFRRGIFSARHTTCRFINCSAAGSMIACVPTLTSILNHCRRMEIRVRVRPMSTTTVMLRPRAHSTMSTWGLPQSSRTLPDLTVSRAGVNCRSPSSIVARTMCARFAKRSVTVPISCSALMGR